MLSYFSSAQLFVTLRTKACQIFCPLNSSGNNPGVGCHAFLQRIFLTQGSNPWLMFPALAAWFFATSTTWKAHDFISNNQSKIIFLIFFVDILRDHANSHNWMSQNLMQRSVQLLICNQSSHFFPPKISRDNLHEPLSLWHSWCLIALNSRRLCGQG